MKKIGLQISVLSFAMLISVAGASAAETWLQCEGTIATTGADGKSESKPAKDVYAYDDATKHLFRYSETRNALDVVFSNDYGPDQIKWGSPAGSSYGDVRWQGVLDRGTMTVKLTRKEKGETMQWSESCKQIQPLG